jgi:prepilin-type N-terminal cleavage/methylation domain-containing protein
MNRRGVTMIELLVVVILIGILANIALPKFRDMRRRADAAHVIGDFNAIRHAVFDYYATHNAWPASGVWAVPPPTLLPHLPGGLNFTYANVRYRYRQWSFPGGMPGNPSQTSVVGVQILATDAQNIQAIRGAYRGPEAFSFNLTVTFVIE